jgi:hypothetical protein
MNTAEKLRRIRRELDECAEQIDRLAAAVEVPVEAQLVGLAEASEITGIARGALRVMRSRGKLPIPTAELAAGPVWRRVDIEHWFKARNGS